MAWESKERLSTGAAQAGNFWEANMNSYQCPLNIIPSLSWKLFVASTALWVAQLWARTVISAWTKGKTQVRLHCAGPGMHGIQIASEISSEGETSAKSKVQMEWAIQVSTPQMLPISSDEAGDRRLAQLWGFCLVHLENARRLVTVEQTVFFYLSLVVSSQ